MPGAGELALLEPDGPGVEVLLPDPPTPDDP